MDVVGIENDVGYVVRNELRKNESLILLNQREMEVVLMRNRIIQGFDEQQALAAGQALDVNFVLMGTVSRINSNIQSHIALFSSANRQIIADWNFTFLNQQDVLNRGKVIGETVAKAIDDFISVSSNNNDPAGAQAAWLESISAEVSEGQSRIKWTVGTFAPESLGFNIYRGLSEQGPFSYISSVIEPEFVDDISGINGEAFYQVSLLTPSGDELRSNQLAKISINVQVESNLAAPAILSVTHLIKGIEVAFLPSAQNIGLHIDAYQLVRRQKGQVWKEVNRISLDSLNTSSNKSDKNSVIKQYTLIDAESQSVSGPVEYAVRATSNGEFGKTSDSISHIPVQPPSLIDTGVYGVRQALVKWHAVQAGKGYNIYRRGENETGEWLQIASVNDVDQTSYVDKDYSAENQAFQYAISVFDDYSSSPLGEPIILRSQGPLPAPLNLTIESGLAGKIALTWQGIQDPDLTGYAIFRTPFSEQVNITLEKIAEVNNPAVTHFVDKQVGKDGSSYYYAVAALNTVGASGDLSQVQQGTSKESPQAVSQFSALLEQGVMKLSWTRAEDTDNLVRYRIERRWQLHTWQELTILEGHIFSFTDAQLLPQGTVEYRIIVVDADNLSSEPISTVPQKNTNSLVILPQSSGLLRKVNLAWQAIPVVEKLQILRRKGGEEWQLITELKGTETHYQDSKNLADGMEYEYIIAVWYAEQLVTQSAAFSVKTKNIPAPKGVSIISGKANLITLNWPLLDDPDIKSYVIYRATQKDAYSSFKFLAEVPTAAPATYTDSVLSGSIEHGVNYRYAIASRNTYDAIGPMGQFFEGKSKKLPSPAFNLSINTEGENLTIRWLTGSETDLQTAEIYRRWNHEEQWTLLDKFDAATTLYRDSLLLPYASAEYKIRLLDVDGLISIDSTVVSAKSPQKIVLRAANQELLRKSELTWSSIDLVKKYKILRSENNVTWQEIATTDKKIFIDDKNLLDEKQYFYKVIALDKDVSLGESNTIEVMTKALPRPPESFKALSGSVKKVELSWAPFDDPDVGGYIVYRSLENGKVDELQKLSSSESRYVDEGGFFSKLEHGTEYQYIISSFNRFKVEGPKSEPISAKTKLIPSPVLAFKGDIIEKNVLLTWQSGSEIDISQYLIYRGKTCSRASKLVSLDNQSTSYIDRTVELGNEYCYYILAKDEDSLESNPSLEVKLILPMVGTLK